jgi:hypothetical protein
MKRLFLALILVAGGLAVTTNANAQVYIGAHIGFRAPFHRAYCAPQVVYTTPAPLPYYDDGVVIGAPVYGYGGYYGHTHYYDRGYNRYYNRSYYHEHGRGYGRRR